MKPKLLDLYCGGGGCSAGYVAAGFEVTGVDIFPQKRYPYTFYQSDALEFLCRNWRNFDAIHASPPCQIHSASTKTWKALGKNYPELVIPTRTLLQEIGLPYVIENVPGAPLINPKLLCGTMFGLKLYRHRLFETSFALVQPEHPKHVLKQAKMGRKPKEDEVIQVVGNFSGVNIAKAAMGISWLGQKELAQAIPPAYTKYVGQQLLKVFS